VLSARKVDVTGDWRTLHINELHHLHFSSNIVRVIISRRMWWANLMGSNYFEDRCKWENNIRIDLHEILSRWHIFVITV